MWLTNWLRVLSRTSVKFWTCCRLGSCLAIPWTLTKANTCQSACREHIFFTFLAMILGQRWTRNTRLWAPSTLRRRCWDLICFLLPHEKHWERRWSCISRIIHSCRCSFRYIQALLSYFLLYSVHPSTFYNRKITSSLSPPSFVTSKVRKRYWNNFSLWIVQHRQYRMETSSTRSSMGKLIYIYTHDVSFLIFSFSSPEQHWSLMPLHAVCSTVRPASFFYGVGAHYGGSNPIKFPQYVLLWWVVAKLNILPQMAWPKLQADQADAPTDRCPDPHASESIWEQIRDTPILPPCSIPAYC